MSELQLKGVVMAKYDALRHSGKNSLTKRLPETRHSASRPKLFDGWLSYCNILRHMSKHKTNVLGNSIVLEYTERYSM